MSQNQYLKHQIRQQLDALTPRQLGPDHNGEAAVLVAVLEEAGQPSFLLTKRSQSVATHKGHISFPGGMRDASDDSLVVTALRETEEELGIEPASIELLGQLNQYRAATGHCVAPFVGYLSDYHRLKPNSEEVEYVLKVPFEFFHSTQPEVEQVHWRGRMRNLYYYRFEQDTIWGLTAAIIRDFLQLLEGSFD